MPEIADNNGRPHSRISAKSTQFAVWSWRDWSGEQEHACSSVSA